MGTKISEVMTERPRAVERETSVRDAAQLMADEDVGSLPVVEGGLRLVGMLTDRDLALRVLGGGLDPDVTRVGDVASEDVVTVSPDDDLDDALTLMARAQVRRLPVIVRDNELVGVVAQADVARTAKDKAVGDVVESISRAPQGPRVTGVSQGGTVGTRSPADDREREAPERAD